MTATVFYDSASEIAFLTNTFLNSSGAAADPATVSCVITDPSGYQVTYTYQGASPADIVKPLVGKYTLSVPCSPNQAGIEGLWSFQWIGTGTVSDTQPGTWRVFPATLANWYCGLEELKDRLGITSSDDDFALQQAIQETAGEINETCSQHFYRITETRTFVPHSIIELNIDALVSITSLNVDQTGDGVYDEAWTLNTDYQLKLAIDRYNLNALGIQRPYRRVQVLQAGKWFPYTYPYSHWDRVQITGTWGWPSVPPQVAQANLILAAQRFKEKDAPFGISGSNDFGQERVLTADPIIMKMLRPFIDYGKKVGV